jgi:hypothetical protein
MMVSWVNLKRPSLLIILNLIAAMTYLSVGAASGSLAHVGVTVFSSPDSREYRAVADWIFGAGPNTQASAWRPYLFPLLLGAAERLGGIRGVWLLNVALWFATLNFAAAATYRFVKSNRASAVVFLVLASNVSLILLSFEGLTEITVVALLAVWIYGISHLTARPTPSQVAWALLPVALLVLVKPEFEMLLAVVAVALIVGIMRAPTRRPSALVFAACLIPVAIQLGIMVSVYGYFGISTIGDAAVRVYFLPRLAVALGQSSDVRMAQPRFTAFSSLDDAGFIIDHLGQAVVVFASILKENLLAGSNFLGQGHPRIARAILITQGAYFVVLLSMIPLVAVALWRGRDGRLALMAIATVNILGGGGLSFWQGDRLTIIALPIWLIAFALAVNQAAPSKLWRYLANPRRSGPPLEPSEANSRDRSPHRAGAMPPT